MPKAQLTLLFPFFLGLAMPALGAGPVNTPAVRIQLVTAGHSQGHSHDISFYGVFLDNHDLAIDVNPHPGAQAPFIRTCGRASDMDTRSVRYAL